MIGYCISITTVLCGLSINDGWGINPNQPYGDLNNSKLLQLLTVSNLLAITKKQFTANKDYFLKTDYFMNTSTSV